ncbi:uncharacterized protein LOC124268579 isoform X1 [Haliotis rubra]|uniref:uncharacterized protein LOC124268579 isoform X1 n=1 Tax=Haliotis rubra TaxID=36100 RepID=UPI001EE5F934|nr:uncharacterized protein LOC124268579 isoform X1 [Haliotis rubra]
MDESLYLFSRDPHRNVNHCCHISLPIDAITQWTEINELGEGFDGNIPEDSDVDGEDYLDLQQLNLLKPISHFSGLDFDKETADRGKNLTTLRNWANPDGSDRKLLYNGMRYENGSITVPAAGVYHITSHVKFYIEDNRKDDKPSRHSSTRLSAIAPPARHRSCCLRMP